MSLCLLAKTFSKVILAIDTIKVIFIWGYVVIFGVTWWRQQFFFDPHALE